MKRLFNALREDVSLTLLDWSINILPDGPHKIEFLRCVFPFLEKQARMAMEELFEMHERRKAR